MKLYKLLFLIVLIISLTITLIDNSEVSNAKIDIYRFETSLFSANNSNIDEHIMEWNSELGPFFKTFNNNILGTDLNSKNFKKDILSFIAHQDMRLAYDSVVKIYPQIDFIEIELSDNFDRYSQFFPKRDLPKVVTYFSGFNYGVVTNDSILAIGLDFFLGKDCSLYKRLNSPEYMRFFNQQEFIIPFCFEAIANKEFPDLSYGGDFLSQMINKGKIMYFLDEILIEYSDADILRYSQDQLDWCYKNEKNVWSYLIDNDILYTTDIRKFRSYIDYAPFAKGMPNDSPGRIAYFIGWNIVNAYMVNNKNVSLNQLMNNSDYHNILQKSKYKP